ncbi:MAG: VWA domain-containing protein, partial [Flavobacteriaceae bacterium]|nr:VWA domain-containing protein [Flavobacteriaceae bacterium]
IVIDNSSSMHYPVANKGKLLFSVLAAAALSYLLQKQRDAVGITAFSDKIDKSTPIKSTSTHLNKLFIELEHLLAEQTKLRSTQVAPVLHEIADKNHKRSLIIIFSDMFDRQVELDEIFKSLQHLKHNNHEVLLFHVTDHQTEYKFEFEDRPYEFIDLESGDKLKINPSQVTDMSTRKVGEYYNELKLRCGQLKIDLIEADIREGFNNILKAYLIKRSRMK